jgi:hypothetical protein
MKTTRSLNGILTGASGCINRGSRNSSRGSTFVGEIHKIARVLGAPGTREVSNSDQLMPRTCERMRPERVRSLFEETKLKYPCFLDDDENWRTQS